MVFFILIPLLVFAVFESIGSLKVALIAAVIAAIGECAFSYYYFNEIDSFSVASIFLVALMAGLAYYKDSKRIFYLKPAILSLAFGLFLIVNYALGHHVIFDGITKYSMMFTPEQQLLFSQDKMTELLKYAGYTVGVSLTVHGIVSALAAYKLSRWWWLAIAGFGVYIFMFVGIIWATIHVY
jgi:intracellular septation protein A